MYPFALTFVSCLVLFYLKSVGTVTFYADSGVLSKCLGFIQSLPGFYIAALAAIATFNKADIDRTMPAPAPSLSSTVRGQSVVIELTRRRFLCSMFAFLTAESIVLVLLSIFGQTVANPVRGLIGDTYQSVVSVLFMALYLGIFWQMIVTTFLGLFYLGERLHQPDAI
jgi:hypothetical protein